MNKSEISEAEKYIAVLEKLIELIREV